MMLLQIMFFGGLVGKLSKLLTICKAIETYLYKEKAWRESACEWVTETFCAYNSGMESCYVCAVLVNYARK